MLFAHLQESREKPAAVIQPKVPIKRYGFFPASPMRIPLFNEKSSSFCTQRTCRDTLRFSGSAIGWQCVRYFQCLQCGERYQSAKRAYQTISMRGCSTGQQLTGQTQQNAATRTHRVWHMLASPFVRLVDSALTLSSRFSSPILCAFNQKVLNLFVVTCFGKLC